MFERESLTQAKHCLHTVQPRQAAVIAGRRLAGHPYAPTPDFIHSLVSQRLVLGPRRLHVSPLDDRKADLAGESRHVENVSKMHRKFPAVVKDVRWREGRENRRPRSQSPQVYQVDLSRSQNRIIGKKNKRGIQKQSRRWLDERYSFQ